jgi:hypothetical protein
MPAPRQPPYDRHESEIGRRRPAASISNIESFDRLLHDDTVPARQAPRAGAIRAHFDRQSVSAS